MVGVVATLWLGLKYHDPFLASFIIATALVIGIVPIYILVNVACMLFYLRERRDEFNVVKHVVVPVLGILVFIPAFAAGAGLKLFDFIAPLAWPLTLGSLLVGIWMAIGVVYMIYLYAKDRGKIEETATVFLEEDPEKSRAGDLGPPLSST